MTDTRVRSLIEAKNEAIVKAYATGDMETLADAFMEEAWQMPPNAPALVGREAIVAFWREALKGGDWSFELDTAEVEISGDMAVERGTYGLSFQVGPNAPEGMGSFQDRGNYVVVWRRNDDGEWRILWDAPVSELPAHA